MDWEWIADDAALEDLVDHLRDQPFVAVDTEFHRERTFYAELALVQLASEARVACIDPLAGVDLAPVDALMADGDVLKVLHAGRQDLEIFFERTEVVPAPLFDTQVAAGLLGRGDQVGYAGLVKGVLGIELSKLHGRTDWMRRPLAEDVVAYATDDVRHLRDVYTALDEELRALGRRPWLDEEQAPLLRPSTYRPPDDEAWHRVKGAGRLKGVEAAVAQAVAAWREATAREVDRPRRRVLADDAILDIARQRPSRPQELERMRSIEPGVRRRHGAALLEVVAEAVEGPRDRWPEPLDRGAPARRADPALVDALGAVLAARSAEVGISQRILATRGELERLAAGDRDVPVLRGWRRELAGDALSAFLAGETRLAVVDGELSLSREP